MVHEKQAAQEKAIDGRCAGSQKTLPHTQLNQKVTCARNIGSHAPAACFLRTQDELTCTDIDLNKYKAVPGTTDSPAHTDSAHPRTHKLS